MSYVWLRYNQDGTTDSRRFSVVYRYDKTSISRGLEEGKRGNLYRFVYGRSGIHTIEIGSDELYIDASRDFLDSYFFASIQYLSLSQEETEPDMDEYFLVDAGEGESPEEYIDGNKHFPFWTLPLKELSSRVWNPATKKFDIKYVE